MKLLLDENLPYSLAAHLSGHECYTVSYMGWRGLRNGELLTVAEQRGFDVVLTLDDHIPDQQNMVGRMVSLVIIKLSSQGKKQLEGASALLIDALVSIGQGIVVRIDS